MKWGTPISGNLHVTLVISELVHPSIPFRSVSWAIPVAVFLGVTPLLAQDLESCWIPYGKIHHLKILFLEKNHGFSTCV